MESTEEIFHAAWECRELFSRCRELIQHPFIGDNWFEEREVDFCWWIYGLRADKRGHSSLDYRLRERSDIRNIVVSLIGGISAALDEWLHYGEMLSGLHIEAAKPTRLTESAQIKRLDLNDGILWDDSDADGMLDEPSDNQHESLGRLSDQAYYIETNLDILKSLSLTIRRSGTRIRYKKADMALAAAPNSYSDLRSHLIALVLVQPYEQSLINTLNWMASKGQLQESLAIVTQAWISDPARINPMQRSLIESVIVRHNRIRFARRSEELSHNSAESGDTEDEPTSKQEDKKRKLSTQQNLSTSTDTPTISVSRAPAPGVFGNIQQRVFASATLSGTATAPGSSFVLPNFGAKEKAVDELTRVTRIGNMLDYPPRPKKHDKGKSFECPYCRHVLHSDYIETRSRWR